MVTGIAIIKFEVNTSLLDCVTVEAVPVLVLHLTNCGKWKCNVGCRGGYLHVLKVHQGSIVQHGYLIK